MRRVESCASAISVLVVSALATHSSPACSAGPSTPTTVAARSHHAMSTPAAANAGAITHSRSIPWSSSHVDRVSSRSASAAPVEHGPLADPAAQLVEGDELLGADRLGGELVEGAQHVVVALP